MNPAPPSLPLPRAATVVLVALMLLAHVLTVIDSLAVTTTPVPAFLGLAILAAVAVWAALVPATPLPLAPTLAATIAPTVVAVMSNFAVTSYALDALWHLSASAFVLLLVTMRGRPVVAWVGMAGAAAATLIWGALSDYGFSEALSVLLRQMPILAIGTGFLAAVSQLQLRLSAVQEEAARLTALEATSLAAAEERRARLRWARSVSQRLLEAIAERDDLDPALRLRAGLVEAELRDGLRAPSLAAEPVTSAARRARERGVEVILLDDRGTDLSESRVHELRARVAAELDSTSAGRFVARVLPDGRTPLATVLVDGPEGRRLELDPAGPAWGPTEVSVP